MKDERDQTGAPEGYEPPAIEEVLSPDELQREVHYAGAVASGGSIG
jgi:hypothetical protein